jgi:hypothetical protein
MPFGARARAASGHARAVAGTVMNSRRRMVTASIEHGGSDQTLFKPDIAFLKLDIWMLHPRDPKRKHEFSNPKPNKFVLGSGKGRGLT